MLSRAKQNTYSLLLLFLIVGILYFTIFSTGASITATMPLTHTVLFQFKTEANPVDVKAAVARFLALKETCVHPTSKRPYILSLQGGKDNSPEGLQVRKLRRASSN